MCTIWQNNCLLKQEYPADIDPNFGILLNYSALYIIEIYFGKYKSWSMLTQFAAVFNHERITKWIISYNAFDQSP